MYTLSSTDSPAGQKLLDNAKEIKARFGEESLVESLKIRLETEIDAIGARPIPGVLEVGTVDYEFVSVVEFGPLSLPYAVGDILGYIGDVSNVFSAIVANELYDRGDARYDLLPDQDCDTRNVYLVCYEYVPNIMTIHSIVIDDVDFPVIFMSNTHIAGIADAFECDITPVIEEELKLVKDDRLSKSYAESNKSFWAEDKDKIAVFIPAVIKNS